MTLRRWAVFFASLVLFSGHSFAQDDAQELAKKLANPVASLISVPFQLNYDQDIGSLDDGDRLTLNIQPVIPLTLNEDWNVISRTILPVIEQSDIFPGSGSEFGLGDTVQSVFFSPKEPTASGWIWGAGPVLLLPTASDGQLGGDKWGLGPTGVALKQQGPWTYGGLVNHIVSFAGDDARSDINATFLQPFISYTTPDAWTYSANLETTRDWENEEWSIPLNLGAAKLTKIGSQLVQFQAGVRFYLESTENGPEGVGLRFSFILLYPK
jgi:hypothetical protein